MQHNQIRRIQSLIFLSILLHLPPCAGVVPDRSLAINLFLRSFLTCSLWVLNDFDGLSIRFWSLGLGVSGNKRATQNTLIQPWQKKEPANYRSLLAKREWNRRTGLIYFHMFCLFVFGRYNIESRWNMERVAGALQPIIRLAKVCSCQPFCWSWSHSAGSSTTSTAFRTEGCISYRTLARTRSNQTFWTKGHSCILVPVTLS